MTILQVYSIFYAVPKGENMGNNVIRILDNTGRIKQDVRVLMDIWNCSTMTEAVRTAIKYQVAILKAMENSSSVEIIGNNPDGPASKLILP